jgi:quinol---cytochrome c reductase iron-sulfur subunit, bacillus type
MRDTNEPERTSDSARPVAAPGRRRFLEVVSLVAGALAAAVAAVPIVGFVLGPMFGPRRTAWRTIGPIAEFPEGQTLPVRFAAISEESWAGVTARTAAWLRHEPGGRLVAFSVNCTHLGCPVRWEPGANLFMCPCHGGVYYANGDVAGGPPPRPLHRYPVRLRDGRVEILAEPIPIA